MLLAALVLVTVVDVFLLRGAKTTETKWGTIRPISQYLLIMLAVTFTWLMGLMGYVRSGLRQHWHVFGVIRDTSPDAFTPTLGFATQVVSFTVLVFFLLIGFIFWLTSLTDKKKFEEAKVERRGLGVAGRRVRGRLCVRCFRSAASMGTESAAGSVGASGRGAPTATDARKRNVDEDTDYAATGGA